jgi:heme iron utilization protein
MIVFSCIIALLICTIVHSFTLGSSRVSLGKKRVGLAAAPTMMTTPVESSTGNFDSFRPSTVDKARTITHICSSGTLCTTSVIEGVEGAPFGSYVDYILDDKGWPVLLLSAQSMHTANIAKNPLVSLFSQLPRAPGQASAALSRVTLMGKVVEPTQEELSALTFAFTLVHSYAEQIVESPMFKFYKIQPTNIYFSGGFGVQGGWVDVPQYEEARPDVLASEVPAMLSRINIDKQGELFMLTRQFLNLENVDDVRIQAVDRLGVDLRVKTGKFTDEYRIGFRNPVTSSEDAKSELVKLFQESWERENGYFFTDENPPIKKYASDILRKRQ